MRYITRTGRFNLSGIVLLAVMLSVSGVCAAADETKASGTTKGKTVKTAVVELKDYQPSLQATGTLVPRRHSQVFALVGGQIEKLPADIGDRVSKGDLLFRIRTVDHQLGLQQAEANLVRAQVIVTDREREKERMKNLYEAGSATQQMFDQTATAYDESRAALAQATAARDIAAQALRDCTVTAPYSGAITARYLQEGEFIGAGKEVLEIMDLSVLNAEMELPERYAGEIAPGLPVILSFSYRPDTVEGKLVAVNSKLNSANRTFLVRVEVKNPEGRLQAGLFCTGTFQLPLRKKQTAIPASALIRDEGRAIVWIIENGTARKRTVEEGSFFNGWVWVNRGLNAGETVITEGQGGLTDGDRVTVRK